MAMIYNATSSNNMWWWADVNRKLDKAEEKALWTPRHETWKINVNYEVYCDMTNTLFSML